MEILKLQNVSLNINGKTILSKINISVEEKTIYSVLGANGAGKSSLAYLIMGCSGYKPSEGKIYFLNEDITDLNIYQRAKIGITLAWQEPARFEGLTVKEYISIGLKKPDDNLIEESLRYVLLEPKEYLNRRIDRTLSGGERKRIELAAVFAFRPKLVILDEPDSGIDILALDYIVQLIKKLKEIEATVILITHREEISEIADKSILLCSGCIVKEGAPLEVGEYFKQKCIPCPSRDFFIQKGDKNA